MQFNLAKTLLALVLAYAAYAGIYIVSPAPPYAATISFVLFLVFGTLVWYIGVQYGTHRANRPTSDRTSCEETSQIGVEPSE